ncbi:MAG: hypothetical protein ACRDQ5_18380, partial [Sciscionella sp.]
QPSRGLARIKVSTLAGDEHLVRHQHLRSSRDPPGTPANAAQLNCRQPDSRDAPAAYERGELP